MHNVATRQGYVQGSNNSSGTNPIPTTPGIPPTSQVLIRTGGQGAVNTPSHLLGGLPTLNFQGESRAREFVYSGVKYAVYGGMQKIQVCSNPSGYWIEVTGRYAWYSDKQPHSDFNIQPSFKWKSRLTYGFTTELLPFGWNTSYDWREISATGAFKYANKINEDTYVQSLTVPFTPVINPYDPIKVSSHMHMKIGNNTFDVLYDVGGVIDIGTIEPGECRVWNR